MNMLDHIAVPDDETLGDRIRSARRSRHWSLETLAAKLGVSKVSVWSWEKNRARPRLEILSQLSDIFGLSLEALINGSGPVASCDAMAGLITAYQRRIAADLGVPVACVEVRVNVSVGDVGKEVPKGPRP